MTTNKKAIEAKKEMVKTVNTIETPANEKATAVYDKLLTSLQKNEYMISGKVLTTEQFPVGVLYTGKCKRNNSNEFTIRPVMAMDATIQWVTFPVQGINLVIGVQKESTKCSCYIITDGHLTAARINKIAMVAMVADAVGLSYEQADQRQKQLFGLKSRYSNNSNKGKPTVNLADIVK